MHIPPGNPISMLVCVSVFGVCFVFCLSCAKPMKHWPPAVFTGGYKIVAVSDDYLYMQFESGKIGYLDDLEFKIDDAKKLVAVRSVSYQKKLFPRKNQSKMSVGR